MIGLQYLKLRIEKMTSNTYYKTYQALRKQVHNLQYSYYSLKEILMNKDLRNAIKKTETIPFFTYSCLNLFSHEAILGITNLLDPHEMHGKFNLTTEKLILELKTHNFNTKKLNIIQSEMKLKTKSLRTYRCKKIAHLDYDLHLSNNNMLIHFNEIKKAVQLLCKFLREIEKMLKVKKPVSFNYESAKIQVENNNSEMLRVIKDALLYRTLLEKGKIKIRSRYPELQYLTRERL
ncbi:MAG: hypothetical protein JW871_04325 [Endomicrobiales bacterium]|nr:hypothetical protein [Endomicrobiales bacterium]